MPITFEIEGFKKKVTDMAVRVNSTQRNAILAGAKIIQDEIIIRAPEKTGNLKRNIVISEIKRDTSGSEYVNVGPEKKKAFYGKMLEFSTTKMAARPFVEPAFRAKKDEALAVMAKIVKNAIESNL